MQSTRLHPILTLAAISLIVFSAVGIAALAGLMPASKGTNKQEFLELPKAIEPAISHPVVAPKPLARKKAAPAAARLELQGHQASGHGDGGPDASSGKSLL